MRARTASMSAAGGDRFSNEHLKFTLFLRMKALEDDPEIPLFFGRLDYDERATDGGVRPGERFYIGRRHVSDEAGDPMVVDWRAPISRPFYRASPQRPMGVGLRRRFGFRHGIVTAYEDEGLRVEPFAARPTSGAVAPVVTGEPTSHSQILEAEIERPRTGPMRDIVATIQPDQDDIVRSDLTASVCVQGAPGTGKTAVGLHRAAYLLYAHRDQLSRQGVLVIGPNDSFLRYIGDVLPALGEIDARQTTLAELVAHVTVKVDDSVEAARVKGDATMARVIERAVWSGVTAATEALVIPMGSRRWRVPAYEADEIVAQLRARGVRYGAGRAMLPQRLAHAVLVKMELAGDSPDDRVQNAVARSRPVKAYVDALWPHVDPRRVVMRLLGDPELLSRVADGLLTTDEQRLISWPKPAKGPASARWSIHDAVLVDEARDLLDRTASLGHLVLDEAQDLSPMMLRCVGRQCSTGSATILGDLAQATTSWGVREWREALAHLGKPAAHVEELTVGFRVPGDVIDYAARLLPQIAPTLATPTSVRRTRGGLVIDHAIDVIAAAVSRVEAALGNEGSIGLIVPDAIWAQADESLTAAGIDHGVLGRDLAPFTEGAVARVDVVPASLAKGLEFDHVVLVEPADITAAEEDRQTGLRRLYVCLTRAVTSLVICHSKAIPVP
ncbi:MAG: ATP-binding domain-containing protein [Actinomycetota bacterium]|nr:ATP-binding domain-containing protein [Actinomycetota bacterium]